VDPLYIYIVVVNIFLASFVLNSEQPILKRRSLGQRVTENSVKDSIYGAHLQYKIKTNLIY
jgi:hypothetical protein